MNMFRFFPLLLLLTGFAGCKTSCQHENTALALEQLAGKQLHGEVRQAEGSLADAQGSEFVTIFDDTVHFHIQTPSGSVDTVGTYSYQRLNDTSATLTLVPESGDGKGLIMLIDLNWTTNGQGTFQGHITEGEKGHESGTFSME